MAILKKNQINKMCYLGYLRSNNEYKINNFLRAGANANIVYTSRGVMSTGTNAWNPIRYAIEMDPLTPVYDDVNGDDQGYGVSVDDNRVNPVFFMDSRPTATNTTKSIYGNAFLEVTPVRNLRIRSDIGVNLSNGYNKSYAESYYHIANFSNDENTITNSASKAYGWQWENTAIYDFSIKDHNFSLLAGISALADRSESFTTARSYLPTEAEYNEEYWYLNAGDSSTASNSGSASALHTMQSYFGRVSYNYKEKYMAEVVVRRDGSSNFGANNKYATFPGLSIGWNLHNEDFWNIENFNSLKLRASWGQNGNENIAPFSYTSTINNDTNYTLGETAKVINGSSPNTLVNPNVKWETSEQLNFGFDASFFKGKFMGSVDWYKKTTKDLLMQPTFSAIYGNDTPYYNVGQVSNSGLEFMVTYRNNIGDLNYGVSFNATYLDNVVDKVGNANGYIDGGDWLNTYNVTRMEEGHAMGYFRLYKTDGIFQTQEEIDSYVDAAGNKLQPNAVPGDLKWVDTNGDGQITDDDRVDCGNPWAKWSYGLNITLDYKGVDLTMNMSAKCGFKVMDSNINASSLGYINLPTFFLDSWSETNRDASVPRLVTTSGDANNTYLTPSDFYLYDGDYLAINLIELGYSLPKKIISKAQISNLRIYVAVDNLANFNSYPYMSTEIADMDGGSDILMTGIDFGSYPKARTFRVGANITF